MKRLQKPSGAERTRENKTHRPLGYRRLIRGREMKKNKSNHLRFDSYRD